MRISLTRLRNTGKHFSSLVGRRACNASRNFHSHRMWKLCVWTGHARLQSKAGRISINNKMNLSTWVCLSLKFKSFWGRQAQPGLNFFDFPDGKSGNPLFAICHLAILQFAILPSCHLAIQHCAPIALCHLAIASEDSCGESEHPG